MQVITWKFCWLMVIILLAACSGQADNKLTSDKKNRLENDSIGVKFELLTNDIATPIEYHVPADNSHRIFITDNTGIIWILHNGSKLPKPFLKLCDSLVYVNKKTDHAKIFSVAFHPNYNSNGKFFVFYASSVTAKTGLHKLLVSEFTTSSKDPDFAAQNSERHVFELEGKNIQNNGAQIAFGPDGYLYISIGDDKLGDSTYIYRAQDLNYLNGKLLRIDINERPYGIPADNPFVGKAHTRPEIWAYGFRKLWRFSFDKNSHQLFGADVGERKQEEIDLVKKGANYGWPLKEGDSCFENGPSKDTSLFTLPIHAYERKDGICIIGGCMYNGSIVPALQKKYVFFDFNGSMYALSENAQGIWTRQAIKIQNKPKDPFLICGSNADENGELVVMGVLNTNDGYRGAIYRVVKE